MSWASRYSLVAAIYLNARGFAYVIFEGPLSPLDWSIVEVRGKDRKEKVLARVNSILARYMPDALVLQNMSESGTHRPHRIRRLNESIAGAARDAGISISSFSRAEIRQHFAYVGSSNTKDAIAQTIAKHIPAFERFLPKPRKPWESEGARMGLFAYRANDAVAILVRFLCCIHPFCSIMSAASHSTRRQPRSFGLVYSHL